MKTIALFIFVFCISIFCQGQNRNNHLIIIDSLEVVLNKENINDEERLDLYEELSILYKRVDALKYYEYNRKAMILGEKLETLDIVAHSLCDMGIFHYSTSSYDSAQYYYNQALEVVSRMRNLSKYEMLDCDKIEARIWGTFGNFYSIQSKFDSAVESYIKTLEIAERNNMLRTMTIASGNLCNIYAELENFDAAERYGKMSLTDAYHTNDSFLVAEAQRKLCFVLYNKGMYDDAFSYADSAQLYFERHPEMYVETLNMNMNLAEIHSKGFGDYDKAMEYVNKALATARQFGMKNQISSALLERSNIEILNGNYQKAVESAEEAFNTDSLNLRKNMLLFYNLTIAYIHLDNDEKATYYLNRFDEIKTTFSNKNYQSSMNEQIAKYETEKKELQISALENEKRLILWISILSGEVLVLALIVMFMLWRLTEKQKRLISVQSVLDGETRERKRLAKDLHDGLGSLITALKLNLESMKTPENQNINNDIDKNIELLNMLMKEMRNIAHYLMPESLRINGLKMAVKDFCKYLPNVRFAYFGNEERFDEKLEIMIYSMIHEFVNNALKHSGGTDIMVQVMQDVDYIAFTVRDNGCGFEVDKVNKGMGLINAKERAAIYKGRVLIDSQPGEGTEINVEFPLTSDLKSKFNCKKRQS